MPRSEACVTRLRASLWGLKVGRDRRACSGCTTSGCVMGPTLRALRRGCYRFVL